MQRGFRTTSTSLRRSLRHTSAARVIKSVLYELAIELNVLMEHGATTMPSVRNVPEAIDAPEAGLGMHDICHLANLVGGERGLILDRGLGAFGDHDVGLDIGGTGQHLDQPHP